MEDVDPLIAQTAEPLHEGHQSIGRVRFERLSEFLTTHARDLTELLELLPAFTGGDCHLRHHLAESGTARLRLDAHRGQAAAQRKDLCLRESNLLSSSGEPEPHGHDLSFGGSQVVAQRDDGGAQAIELVLGHLGDIRETGQVAGRFLAGEVGGHPEIGHDPAEAEDVARGDAELTRGLSDIRELRRSYRDLFGEILELVTELGDPLSAGIDGLRHAGHRILELDRCHDGRCTESQDRRCHVE